MTLSPDKLMKNLSPNGSLLILILFILAPMTFDYLKENKVVKSLQELQQTFVDSRLNNLTKRGAIYVYTATFYRTEDRINAEIDNIINANNISDPLRQIEIRDRLHNRIAAMYDIDFTSLSQFYYNGIPLSFALRDVDPVSITNLITDYMLNHTEMNHTRLKEDLRNKLSDRYTMINNNCINSLDKIVK